MNIDGTFTLIELNNIVPNRYYIRYDGEVFDDKEMIFLDCKDRLIHLEDINGNIIYYIRDELLALVFLPSLYDTRELTIFKSINKTKEIIL